MDLLADGGSFVQQALNRGLAVDSRVLDVGCHTRVHLLEISRHQGALLVNGCLHLLQLADVELVVGGQLLCSRLQPLCKALQLLQTRQIATC